MRETGIVLLALASAACSARDHHAYRLPSACQEARNPDQAESCGGWLLDELMTAQFGVYRDDELERYVRGIGERVASHAGRDDVEWTFRILDDPGAQAWAAPGGFVYVTRGLLALLDTEAELAAILGHEVAHVAAGHTEELLRRLPIPRVQGLDLATLFQLERDDEAQADQLGVRYAEAAGYDPSALQRALRALHQPGLGSAPSWSDRHPPLPTRLSLAARVAGANPEGRHGRQRYLNAITGLVVGEDPRRGFVVDGRFVHATAGLSFALPPGWEHSGAWSVGRLRSQWFRAWDPDESASLLFFPLSHAHGSVFQAAMEAEMQETRATKVAGYDAVEGVLPAEGTEVHVSGEVAGTRMLVIRGRDNFRYGLMMVRHGSGGGLDGIESVYRAILQSAEREREPPVRPRRIRPREFAEETSLGSLIAAGCAAEEERPLLAILNEIREERSAGPGALKCLAP
ncbi:MAG: M48 family metalloprotease [Myxococcota bacterium]